MCSGDVARGNEWSGLKGAVNVSEAGRSGNERNRRRHSGVGSLLGRGRTVGQLRTSLGGVLGLPGLPGLPRAFRCQIFLIMFAGWTYALEMYTVHALHPPMNEGTISCKLG